MNRLYFGAVLIALIALNGCAGTLPPLMTGDSSGFAQEDWQDYGAVYEYDELRIKTKNHQLDEWFTTYYYVNQKIRVLSLKGVEHGTVEVEEYGGNLIDFKVQLIDAAGRDILLDLDQLRSKYTETGKIIVPKVEPGCLILIRIVFKDNHPAYNFERWFEKSIPVLKSRFSLFFPTSIEYDCKAYGGVKQVDRQSAGALRGYVWNHENVLPEDDVFEGRWHHDQKARVLVRMKRWHVYHYRYKAPGWDALARKYNDYFLSPSIFTFRSTIKKRVEDITSGLKVDFNRADAILKYVQDEITLDEDSAVNWNAINIHSVLKAKKGNVLDITLLLKEMFKAAGFEVHVYATRSRFIGQFDPDFPCWRYVNIPLVAVETGNQQLVAYPYARNIGLGEYPYGFHEANALDLEKGAIAALPTSIHTQAKRKSTAVLSTRSWEDDQQWEFVYSGYYATLMRAEMSDMSTSRKKTYLRSLIHDYDKENSLEDVDFKAINRQGDIKIELGFRNSNARTKRANATHYSLKPWFRKYFTDYDKSRKVNYTNDMALVYEDSVLIEKQDKTQQSIFFECADLDNPLFCAQCRQTETQDGTLLSRTLTVKRADLTPDQMRAIYPDIVSVNRITESYMIEKQQ